MSSSKRRECPALGKTITSADCGAQRHSRIPCPAECPFNPFAPARRDEMSALDARVWEKWYERLRRDPVGQPTGMGASLPGEEGTLLDAMRIFRQSTHLRDARGLTFWQRWEQARWEGLKNDEQVVLSRWSRARVRLMEVRGFRMDGELLEVEDVWDPSAGRFLLDGGEWWELANRFDGLLCLVLDMPHYRWARCGMLRVTPSTTQSMPARAEAILSHLGCPVEPDARQAWLAEHLERVQASVEAVRKIEHAAHAHARDALAERREWMDLNVDARGELENALRARTDCRCRRSDDGDDGERVEIDVLEAESHPLNDTNIRVGLGSIHLEADGLELVAMGHARLVRLRDWLIQVGAAMANPLAVNLPEFPTPMPFLSPLNATEAGRLPPDWVLETVFDPMDRAYCAVTADGTPASEIHRRLHGRRWQLRLDQPMHRLGGLSVRQALADPRWRGEAMEWVKSVVNRMDGGAGPQWSVEEEWVWSLGLGEIQASPPPPRPEEPPLDLSWMEPPEFEEDFEDETEDWEDDGAGDARPSRAFAPGEIRAADARLKAREPTALRLVKKFRSGNAFEVFDWYFPFGDDEEYDTQIEHAVLVALLAAFPDGNEPAGLQRGRLLRYAREEMERIQEMLNAVPTGEEPSSEALEAWRASAKDAELGKFLVDAMWHPLGFDNCIPEYPVDMAYALAFAFGLLRELAHHRPPGQPVGGCLNHSPTHPAIPLADPAAPGLGLSRYSNHPRKSTHAPEPNGHFARTPGADPAGG